MLYLNAPSGVFKYHTINRGGGGGGVLQIITFEHMVLNTPLNDCPVRILKCGKYSEHIKLIETLQAASWLEDNIQNK